MCRLGGLSDSSDHPGYTPQQHALGAGSQTQTQTLTDVECQGLTWGMRVFQGDEGRNCFKGEAAPRTDDSKDPSENLGSIRVFQIPHTPVGTLRRRQEGC